MFRHWSASPDRWRNVVGTPLGIPRIQRTQEEVPLLDPPLHDATHVYAYPPCPAEYQPPL